MDWSKERQWKPVLGRQRQEGLSEFEASLVYRMSSRTVGGHKI